MSMAAVKTLEEFVKLYDSAIEARIRRFGFINDFEDVKQDFYVRLLEKDYLSGYNPAIAAFSTYIESALFNFMVSYKKRTTRHARVVVNLFIASNDGLQELSIANQVEQSKDAYEVLRDYWEDNSERLRVFSTWPPFEVKVVGDSVIIVDPILLISLVVLGFSKEEISSLLCTSIYAINQWYQAMMPSWSIRK
jgi:DNA-directed RNA polymerase specialized sigma24 family protein